LDNLPGVWSSEVIRSTEASLTALGYSPEEVAEAMASDTCSDAGEPGALHALEKWCYVSGSADCGKTTASWDLPLGKTAFEGGHDPLAWKNLSEPHGWMQMSKYLALGCISPRQLYWRTLKCRNHPGVVHRLLWREWHRLNSIKWGRRLFWLQGPGRVERPWSSDEAIVGAWKAGRTGIPYIDACMRELRTTGWLAYKGRKTAGAFLVHNLGVDWRIGAYWYEETLLDYDCAMNYGNWVTVARVDRYYDGEDFVDKDNHELICKLRAELTNDPEGTYIRRWVPELAEVPTEHLQWPWLAGSETPSAAQYPAPIIGKVDPFKCQECSAANATDGTLDPKSGTWFCQTCCDKWNSEQKLHEKQKPRGKGKEWEAWWNDFCRQEIVAECSSCKATANGYHDKFDGAFYCTACWVEAGWVEDKKDEDHCNIDPSHTVVGA